MHHRPAAPPFSARFVGALAHCALLLRAVLRLRTGRVVLTGVLSTIATGLVLAVPVIAGSEDRSSDVVFDASTSAGSDVWSAAEPAEPEELVEPAAPGTTGAAPAPAAPAAPATDEPATDEPTASTPNAATLDDPATGPSSSSSASSSAAGEAPPSVPDPTTPSAPQAPDATPLPAVPAEVQPTVELLALIDQVRAAAGCDPVTPDAALADLAQVHSKAMRDEGDLDLLDVDGDSVLEQGASAAAVAHGESDADDVLDDWVDDDDAEALRNCALTSAGIGLAEGDDGPWWTLLLA